MLLLAAVDVLPGATPAPSAAVHAAPRLDPPTNTPTPTSTPTPTCCGSLTVGTVLTNCHYDPGANRTNIHVETEVVNNCTLPVTANINFYLQLTAQNPPTGGWDCWDEVTLTGQSFPAQTTIPFSDTVFLQEQIPAPPTYKFYRILMRLESPDLYQTLDVSSGPDYTCVVPTSGEVPEHVNCIIPPPPEPTSTPTRTPTATPTCMVPTPFAYPWGCVPSPTAAFSFPTPIDIKSHYIVPTHTPGPGAPPTPQGGHWQYLGPTKAQRAVDEHYTKTIITVLDFGAPYVVRFGGETEWGTLRIASGNPYISLDEIKKVAGDVATGFYQKALQYDQLPHLIIAVGTSNYWDPGDSLSANDFYNHGRQWGYMIKSLNLQYSDFGPIVTFEGANDIEFAWSDPDRALKWAKGFEEVTRLNSFYQSPAYHYYVNGSCDGCYCDACTPVVGNPNASQICAARTDPPYQFCWPIDQIIGVMSANRAARPLPQIYFEHQPSQWRWLSSYADTHDICLEQYSISRGITGRMLFKGVTAEGNIPNPILPGGAAWEALWRELTTTSCTSITAANMEFTTPIQYYPYQP